MVSLEDFVASTLIQIVRGAAKAQEILGQHVIVGPPIRNESETLEPDDESPYRHDIEFDLMLTADQENASAGKTGVDVKVWWLASLNASGDLSSSTKTGMVNRVKFTVPLQYDVRAVADNQRHEKHAATMRERSIQLYKDGKSVDEIAQELAISDMMVEAFIAGPQP